VALVWLAYICLRLRDWPDDQETHCTISREFLDADYKHIPFPLPLQTLWPVMYPNPSIFHFVTNVQTKSYSSLLTCCYCQTSNHLHGNQCTRHNIKAVSLFLYTDNLQITNLVTTNHCPETILLCCHICITPIINMITIEFLIPFTSHITVINMTSICKSVTLLWLVHTA